VSAAEEDGDAFRDAIQYAVSGITPEQRIRIDAFQAAHPGAVIVLTSGLWKGHVPAGGGAEVFKVRREGPGRNGGGLDQLIEDLEAEVNPDG
jgi:hypothetical protein